MPGAIGPGRIPAGLSTKYVGSNIPASGSYVGQLIQVDNAAVPGGRSILRWTGALWAPPAGELIIFATGKGSALADVSPGSVSLTEIYASTAPPDYMIPDGLLMGIDVAFGAVSSSPTAGCIIGCSLSGNTPTSSNSWVYPRWRSFTPGSGNNFDGLGGILSFPMPQQRNGLNFILQDGATASRMDQNASGPFVSGNSKIRCMAKPSNVGDRFRVDYVRLTSMGL